MNDIQIKESEKLLNIKFPSSFKWFLKKYGTGGINGVEILGGGLLEIPTCVEATKEWRKLGLPMHYVVVENCDEWLYCIDTSQATENDENPVIDWSQNDNVNRIKYKNFYEFLLKRFSS